MVDDRRAGLRLAIELSRRTRTLAPHEIRDLPSAYLTGLAAVALAVLAPVIPLVYCGIDLFAYVVPLTVAVLAVIFVGTFIPPIEGMVEGLGGCVLIGSALFSRSPSMSSLAYRVEPGSETPLQTRVL